MSFASLKKNRSDSISKLTAAAEKLNTKQYEADGSYWTPTVDKAGNGYAVIRFLPAPEGEDLPWVRYFDHGFKGSTGRWYIENSRTTLGEKDPVSDYNTKLWNSTTDDKSPEREQARKQKRRLHYVSNILVETDPGNPANEGKVFRYKYGKKIWDKINEAMQPEFEDEKPINPFDFWTGANFKLKIRKVEGWTNYDRSEFDDVSELFKGDEKKLEAVYKDLKPLQEIVDPKNYKTYAELQKKLIDVLGQQVLDGPVTAEDVAEQEPGDRARSTPAPEAGPEAEADDAPPATGGEETVEGADEEGSMSYFAKLAKS